MGDRLVFILACLVVLGLLSMLVYGAVWVVGRVLFGPPAVAYQPTPVRVDRRGPRGPLRPPSKPPEWSARHAKPRHRDPHPDCPVDAVVVPDRPDAAPVLIPLCGDDTQPIPQVQETAA